MDSPSHGPLLVIFLHSWFLREMGNAWEGDSPTASHKEWRLKFNFHVTPEDQSVLSSQRALPLMETKWKERCSGREKECPWSPCHLEEPNIYSLVYKTGSHSCFPITTEDRRKKNSKTIRAFAQICLLQLGEGGQSKDLSPLERELWPWWWWTLEALTQPTLLIA